MTYQNHANSSSPDHSFEVRAQGDDVSLTIGYDARLSFTLGISPQAALTYAEELRHAAQKILNRQMFERRAQSAVQEVPVAAPAPVPVPTKPLTFQPPLDKRERDTQRGDAPHGLSYRLLEGDDSKLTVEHLWLLDDARYYLESFGLDEQDIVEMIKDPQDFWIDATGGKAVFVAGDFAVVTGKDNYQVLSIMPASRALASKPNDTLRPQGPKSKGRKHDGDYPTSIQDLNKALGKLKGVHVVRLKNSHWRVSNRNGRTVYPSTPSDHRSLINTIKQIEHELKISLRR